MEPRPCSRPPRRPHRRRAGTRSGRHPAAACGGVDRAAGAVLPQSAARSDRGADLRPRMAARLRQAAAAAVVAGRDRLPAGRAGFRLLPAGAAGGGGGAGAGLARRHAAARPARGVGGGADRRRPALPQLHRRQVQSRRDPAAVLGAGRLRLPSRAAAASAWRLDPARPGARHLAVGEIFRHHAGGADGAVPAARPRRPQDAGDAGALHRRRRGAGDHGAASDLAGAERLSAAGLCRAARRAAARPDRSSSGGRCNSPPASSSS